MDAQQRMFISSDSTGEIWVLAKADSSTSTGGGTPTGTGPGSGTAASPTDSGNAASSWCAQAGLLSALF